MTLILIAFAVAMDCTAVSAAYALRRISRTDLVKLALTFGSFQALTALAGALGGSAAAKNLGSWNGWIAFLLLLGVGGHMIYEALFDDGDEVPERVTVSPSALLILGIATSIDSLAVGVSLPALGLPIYLSVAAIGMVSFLMSFVGAWAGTRAGEKFGPSAEALGGLVLIGIGIHALVTGVM